MHFVTGGAFNGKRRWVRKMYPDAKWISAHEGESLLEALDFINSSIVVLEGLETWIKDYSLSREEWKKIILDWEKWEQEKFGRQLVLIGTDIGKGIVPLEKENRNWRDLTGWLYQDIAAVSEKVDVIWYGINQTIKG